MVQSEGGEKRAEESEFGADDWIDDEMGVAMDEVTYGGEKEMPARLRGWDGEEYGALFSLFWSG